ncbi:MAG TPA: phosphoglucomutase/phosphomannomutase family protein [Thermoanaerobacterales bacterium]|nr:phosphoglucomutase/phosphomannomutase family protein [Thermoanaerobacterales bacterium]
MSEEIKFGTDGWRGIIAKDFTFDNVNLVAGAIALYINRRGLSDKGVVVGYDKRFLSEQFAESTAEVLARHGIPVFLSDKPVPTPVAAYAIKVYDTAGAVMITASHNPPYYNGMKYIPEYAGPALPHITGEIEENLKKIISKSDRGIYFKGKHILGKHIIKRFNIDEIYLEHIKQLIPFDDMRKVKLKVIIDPMYGAGIGYLKNLFDDLGWSAREINNKDDPLFGGNLPEPTSDRLTTLREWVIKTNAAFGLALDGDADRFGVIDSDGSYISSNQVLYILLNYLINRKGLRGPVCRTVATTHMLDVIAEKYGMNIIETPVGFKYIGECLFKERAILGGEESGGLSIIGHIPEKDGILANALMAGVSVLEGKSFKDIINDIKSVFGYKVSKRLDINCSREKKQEILDKMTTFKPDKLIDKKVVETITIDGLKHVMEDGSWCLVRPSGTEALFRIYAEAGDIAEVEGIQNEVRDSLGL